MMPIQPISRKFALASLSGLVALSPVAAHDPKASLAEFLASKIRAEQQATVTTVPLRRHMGKIAIDASVDGVERQFIFDTGSPTIISRSFAAELDLEIVGSNVGADANGTPVRMDIARVARLSIGDMTFFDVPVMVHDFDTLDLGPCFFDGGLIGSEIFPGYAWRIDLDAQTVEIAADSGSFPARSASGPAIETTLTDFGYPHAPIVDYSVGKMEDKALVDTGNSEKLSLFAAALKSEEVRKAIVPGSQREGRGSHGTSSGGEGEMEDLARMVLSSLHVGDNHIERVETLIRPVPPSLLGLGLMRTHRLTLDYPAGIARFVPFEHGDRSVRDRAGFAVAARGERFEVVQLYEGSRAEEAGLRLEDEVAALDGHELDASDRDARCDTTRWLTGSDHVERANRVTVIREGERVELKLRPPSN